MQTIILLIGVNGAGKTNIATRLADALPSPVVLDAERRAFDRRFMMPADQRTPALHESVIAHCRAVTTEWRASAAPYIVVDRWYETYAVESGLTLPHLARIENDIVAADFTLQIVNLVIGGGFEGMLARLKHTKEQRPADWWDPSRGTLEERAAADVGYQDINRRFAASSRFPSIEIDTTGCEQSGAWDSICTRAAQHAARVKVDAA